MTCTIPQGKPGHASNCEHNRRKKRGPSEVATLRAEVERLRKALEVIADGQSDPDMWARAALRGDGK